MKIIEKSNWKFEIIYFPDGSNSTLWTDKKETLSDALKTLENIIETSDKVFKSLDIKISRYKMEN